MGPKMVQADQNCQPKVVPPTKDGLYACAAFLSIVEQEQMTLVRCSKLKEMHQKSFTHVCACRIYYLRLLLVLISFKSFGLCGYYSRAASIRRKTVPTTQPSQQSE